MVHLPPLACVSGVHGLPGVPGVPGVPSALVSLMPQPLLMSHFATGPGSFTVVFAFVMSFTLNFVHAAVLLLHVVSSLRS